MGSRERRTASPCEHPGCIRLGRRALATSTPTDQLTMTTLSMQYLAALAAALSLLGCASGPPLVARFDDLRYVATPITLTPRVAIDETPCEVGARRGRGPFRAQADETESQGAAWAASVDPAAAQPPVAAREVALSIDTRFVTPHNNTSMIPLPGGTLVMTRRVASSFDGRMRLSGELIDVASDAARRCAAPAGAAR